MCDLLTIALLGPFVPRWCAVRTQHASRRAVWSAHILGLLLGTVLLTTGWCWAYSIEQARPAIAMRGAVSTDSPWPSTQNVTIFAISALLLGVIMTGVAAIIVLPMAWRDEAMRDTWQHALRTVRLFAPAWMPVAALFGVILMLFFTLAGQSAGPDGFIFLLLTSWTVLPLWCLYVVDAAAGAERPFEAVAHEPLCENCGYLLHHVPETLRCPECGEDIQTALDPTWRDYPLKGASIRGNRNSQFDVLGIAAATRPAQFFRRVRLDHPAWPLIVRSLAAHAVAGGLGWVILVSGFLLMNTDVPIMEFMGLTAGIVSALMIGAFGIWRVGAGVVGLIAGALHGRNLLRAALIIAAYSSIFYIVWSITCVLAFLVILLLGMLKVIHTPFWPMSAWFTLNVSMALIYIFGVWRRMRYVRFGNWRFASSGQNPSASEDGVHSHDLVGVAQHDSIVPTGLPRVRCHETPR